MRAVCYKRTGAANDVLEAGEQPMPEPGPGEVRDERNALNFAIA